jgi:hypothetical protein
MADQYSLACDRAADGLRLRTDPEAVIYNALVEAVSVRLLNFESDALSENEQKKELEVVASHVLTSLFNPGYRFATSKVE